MKAHRRPTCTRYLARMRPAIALAAYAALMASLLTDLYAPLEVFGPWWATVLLFGAAHVGVGLLVRTWWALAVPLPFLLAVGGPLGVLVLGLPLAGAVALGRLLGRLAARRAALLGTAAFLAALVPAGLAIARTAGRGPHVPAAVQARLPVDYSLVNLCPGAETPAALERRIRASAETLIRELRRRPNELVTYTFYYEDADDVTLDITVRELAHEQLEDLDCDPHLQQRIREAMI
jgi:hypothetical protein